MSRKKISEAINMKLLPSLGLFYILSNMVILNISELGAVPKQSQRCPDNCGCVTCHYVNGKNIGKIPNVCGSGNLDKLCQQRFPKKCSKKGVCFARWDNVLTGVCKNNTGC